MWWLGSAAALQFGLDGGSAAPHLISAASRHRWQMRAAVQQLGSVAAQQLRSKLYSRGLIFRVVNAETFLLS